MNFKRKQINQSDKNHGFSVVTSRFGLNRTPRIRKVCATFVKLTTLQVLGTPLLVTDYENLAVQCQKWARGPERVALEFANTQIVTMRRHESWFRDVSEAFDYLAPDGMPLIWCLNRAGAGLRDRVYGPTFMRKCLAKVPGNFTHYLLGGSEECAARLRENMKRVNPDLKFVGSFHGFCRRDGTLEGRADQDVVDEINRLSPDFIWLSFGAPKQQMWVKRHKHLVKRGVLLTVGFAFDVNAGTKRDAPEWMQRSGLTWVFRLASEPRRLGPRYFKYNALFLYYLLRDGLRGKAWGKG
ncbi:MAG TPA: WecB/TagA/CpsF family glycosyltransferase [Verrucomicrobiae bacterium]|nr:WecB/TagA/CpsF family glycosyltransferase [Verrucomicrobiae bacterium]